jgi:hypothetical protein
VWPSAGACSSPDVNPEIFFPEKASDLAEARKVCETCNTDVKNFCLSEALKNEAMGVWSGTEEFERARMLGRSLKRREGITTKESYKAYEMFVKA